MAGTRARRRRSALEGIVQRVTHPLGQGLQHRDVNTLAFTGLLAVHQRGEDVGVGVHASSNIGHRVAGLDRCFGRAGDRHKTGFALDQEVVGFFVPVRAVAAVAGDVADDDAGLDFGQGFIRQAQPCGRPRRQVLYHHVCLFENQAHQKRLPGFMLDVQGQALLGTVGPDKVRGQALDARVIAAREVAHARALYFDHARAHIGELARGKGRGNRVLQADNGDALEGLHMCFRFGFCLVRFLFDLCRLRPVWRPHPWSASLRGPAPTVERSCRRQQAHRERRKHGCQRSGAPL